MQASSKAQTAYNTFPDGDKKSFKWEAAAAPWMLFVKSSIASGKILFSLAMLVHLLFRFKLTPGANAEQGSPVILPCDPRYLSSFQVGLCEYTKAYLRGFPLLAISVTLGLAMRTMLQMKIYYGLLKCGGLLDFENIEAWRDPISILMTISLLHGVAHFVLKMTDGRGEPMTEAIQTAQTFLVPCALFMAFFYSSYDLESSLVPLNKYFEEDPEYCQQALANVQYMDERVVSFYVLSDDVFSQAYPEVTDDIDPCISKMYNTMIQAYPKAQESCPESDDEIFKRRFNQTMWPAKIVLDHRLKDDSSKSLRRMFALFLCLSFPVQVCIFGTFAYQAVWKDLYNDVYLEGQDDDILSSIVLIGHAVIVGWVTKATILPVYWSMWRPW